MESIARIMIPNIRSNPVAYVVLALFFIAAMILLNVGLKGLIKKTYTYGKEYVGRDAQNRGVVALLLSGFLFYYVISISYYLYVLPH